MSHRVEIAETQQVFMVAPGESVLDAALRSGVDLAHECTFGGCGTCRVRVVQGSVSYEDFPMGLSEAEAADGYALACQARPDGDLVLSTAREASNLAPARRTTTTVRAVSPLGPDVLHLQLALPDDEPFDFAPGQYLKVLLEDGTHRSFSMASAPNGNVVDFHVRQIANGRFTSQQLPRLHAGDTLDVEIPHGSFSLHKEDYRPLLMVATGTGLAPIKSMLESLMDDPDCPPVWLYWGMRTAADLYLHEEIASWGERLYDFQYVPVLSRGDDTWHGRRGYVHDAVAADLGDLSEHAIYLCGSPNMIHDAKQTFMALGAQVPFLRADGFTFQHGGG
ncbi:2Fe-2S iron-sulfur cluster-binding protein [Cupriavidus sp. SW-Y-13]|uniref:2Fe-2S iron-sulfur cluster-binding protein n=1 Tax=Cupriavidus sp. SW-Y-13 TaxID=2653854 RepID=UPI001365E48E|nr:2Fe-2S iron-sulfur cluster-binding protein [Cupriavidus sp. SW-Y-13]MWL90671.1 2Fe-2S iron-sulfur cluster binding domain-containing protein [Cupriavidus sp. SW-Y-13]